MNEPSSVFAKQIVEFITYKRALGMKYIIEARYMKLFDRWCIEQRITNPILTQQIVEKWVYKRPTEKSKTHSNRISIIREFAKFLNQSNQNAYVCTALGSINASTFAPYIFSRSEISALFQAADSMQRRFTPYMHIVIPSALRVLYGCGLRTCEVRNLKKEDVDWEKSVFVIRNSKNGKDRLVPFSKSLAEYLQTYYEQITDLCPCTDYLFPNSIGKILCKKTIYVHFCRLLSEIGIQHRARGENPRVHDLRHTFAVHSLQRLEAQGVDLYAELPIFSAYLGHSGIKDTEKYLRLTSHVFPEIAEKIKHSYGNIILPIRKEVEE